jgi:Bacterial TSP3 repeat
MRATTFAGRGRWRLGALTLLVLALAGAPTWAMAARLVSLAQEGPATGHAQVVAQGVAALPTGEIVWRVAYHEARLPEDAPRVERDLGFLVADQGPVLLTDEGAGTRTHLAPGEAAFVYAGTEQRRASTAGRPVGYYALDLVPAAEAGDVGTAPPGIAVFASSPFAAPAGEHDLDLVRDVLATDETATLPAGAIPTLVVATAGTLEVAGEAGEPTPLNVGQATAVAGAATVRATGLAGATFVAAVVRPVGAAPATPVASPAATPLATPVATPVGTPDATPEATGPGVIEVTLFACPPEASPADFDPDQCDGDAAVVDLTIAVLGTGENERDLDDAERSAATARWSGLPFGTYLLRATGFAEGYGRFFVADLEGLNSPPEEGYTAGPNEGYLVPLSVASSVARLEVFAFAGGEEAPAEPTAEPGAGTGEVAYEVFACPVGITVEAVDPAACEPATEGAVVALSGGGLEEPLTGDQALPDEAGRPTWRGLAPGEYVFSHGLPEGFVTYTIPESPIVTLLEDGSGYAVTVEEGAPKIVLAVYDIQPAAPPPTEAPPPEPEPEPEPPPAPADTDGDGLSDDEEINIYATDPGLFDTDFDGFSDYEEVFNGTDPLDPGSFPPPAA